VEGVLPHGTKTKKQRGAKKKGKMTDRESEERKENGRTDRRYRDSIRHLTKFWICNPAFA